MPRGKKAERDRSKRFLAKKSSMFVSIKWRKRGKGLGSEEATASCLLCTLSGLLCMNILVYFIIFYIHVQYQLHVPCSPASIYLFFDTKFRQRGRVKDRWNYYFVSSTSKYTSASKIRNVFEVMRKNENKNIACKFLRGKCSSNIEPRVIEWNE